MSLTSTQGDFEPMKISKKTNRIIGEYNGKNDGPLLICLGGMHGNEPAGVKALEQIFKLLAQEPIQNPSFRFNGNLIALRGNLPALDQGFRYLDCDLNRLWTEENVQRIYHTPEEDLLVEEGQLKEIHTLIHQKIEQYQPKRVVLLDLHTTTATGGIFSISTDDPESRRIAVEMHAPVILGMLRNINGTTLHYFNNDRFEMETTAVCFESGQHNELDSVDNAVSALINCMRSINCLNPNDVENKHDELLIRMSSKLPKVAELLYGHDVIPEDNFVMKPGYVNFDPVKLGEELAKDKNGSIIAKEEGMILMPLYQKIGEDGFFMIREVD